MNWMRFAARNAACAAAVFLSPVTNAAMIDFDYEGRASLFEAGQITQFTVRNTSAVPEGNNGLFTITAKGDYTPNERSEFVQWSINDVISGRLRPAPEDVLMPNNPNDVEWTRTVKVFPDEMRQIGAKGSLAVTLANSPDVDFLIDRTDYFSWKLTAVPQSPVPLPAAVWFLISALGMVGVMGRRRSLN